MSKPAKSYHHGNLRDALIIAAAELIEEHGSLEFSITDAARRAGVSNAAPYRHFKDKDDLLDNVRHLAFMGLRQRMQEVRDAPGTAPGTVDKVISLGLAYLQYAREKRAFFSLMWEDRGQMAAVRQDGDSKMDGFYVLVDAVSEFCECQGHLNHQGALAGRHRGPVTVATQLWALAHGMATLEANHMLDLFDRGASAEKLLTDSTRALLAGLHLDRPRSAAKDKTTVSAAANDQQQTELF